MTKLQVQMNTTAELNTGDVVQIVGTGQMMTDEKEHPSLEVTKEGENKGQFVALIPGPETAIEGVTPAELAEAHPDLLNEGGSIEATVVKSVPTDIFYNAYLLEVQGPASKTLEKRLNDMATMKTFDLTIKGGILQHPAKVDVIEDFEEGKDVTVKLQLNSSGEPSVVYPEKSENHSGNSITAGEIKFKDDQKETLMKLLKACALDGVVFEVENNSYTVRVGVDSDEYEAITTGKKLESIEEVMKDIHTTVGTPMETLEDIHVYLHSQGVNKKQIKTLLRKIRRYDESVADFIPHKPKTAYQDNKSLLKRSIAYLLGGESILMSGDAATGKNLMAETLCWAIQKPYRFYSINIQTDKFDLTGRTVLQSQAEGGGTRVQDSFLIQMMKHGGAILLDEMNASNPAIMTVLHSVAEKGHKMIDVESSDERVVAKDDFVLFGAMNPGYNGTGDLNEALHSRFATLNFGNNEEILGLLQVHHESKDAPENMLKQVNKIYETLYENVKDGLVGAKVLSFRRYASAVKYASEGIIPLKDAMIDNVANMILDPEENEIICDAIDTHIA